MTGANDIAAQTDINVTYLLAHAWMVSSRKVHFYVLVANDDRPLPRWTWKVKNVRGVSFDRHETVEALRWIREAWRLGYGIICSGRRGGGGPVFFNTSRFAELAGWDWDSYRVELKRRGIPLDMTARLA